MLSIYLRVIFIYFVLVFAMRVMGKRQVGELRVSELIVAFLLSEVAVQPIVDRSKPILFSIISIFLLLSIEVIISFILMKSVKLKRIVSGAPVLLIRRGKIMVDEMTKNRIEFDELYSEIRQSGYGSIREIYYAVLEENGKISVFPRENYAPLRGVDVGVKCKDSGIDHILVIDGKILGERLSELGWDEKRLLQEIKRYGVSLDELLIFTVDDSGQASYLKRCGKQ